MSNKSVPIVIVSLMVVSGFLGFITFEPEVVDAGTIIYVGSGAGNDSATITGGITLASDGDTVYVYSGVYVENIWITKTLNLTGEDKHTTIIDGSGGTVVMILSTDWVNITGFTITNGSRGVELNSFCDNNKVINNIIDNHAQYGVLITNTNSNNDIINNTINNTQTGIYLWNSNTNNIFKGNTVTNSSSYGIYLWASNTNNKIYHNNFVNYVNQPYDDSTNSWDNGYPIGGNFWGDYSGGDNRSGPAQNIPGNDGLGDVSYSISGGSNVDNYPLWPNWDALGLYRPSPGKKEVCEYAIGSVKVAVIFMESNGSIDPESENWSSARKSTVVSEIQDALTWWEGLEVNASLSFSILNVGSKNTSYEPITHPHTNESLWIGEIMKDMGYTSGTYLEKVQSYNHWLREQYNTDWAYTIFVADSFNDTDGNFSDPPWCAWAYWEYGCIVMTYDNGEWGISRMNNVTAHETGHMFYATDEYNGATNYNGYLNAADEEWSGCLMYNNNLVLSSGTKLQIGWRDTDNDGIMDILDTEPNTYLIPYNPDPTMDNTPTYIGYAVVVPYPNNNPSGSGRDVTLNTIANVQYRMDNGTWSNAVSTDGAFDEAIETFQFTTSQLSTGTHFIEARAVNSVNNNDSTYANDTITILPDTVPPEIEETTFENPATGDYYNITANVIDNVDVDTVWLEYSITSSEGYFETRNVSMNLSTEPSYWVEVNIWSNTTWFNYTIKANDTSDNWNGTSIITLAFKVHNLDTGEDFVIIQAAIDDLDTLDGHTIYVDNGIYYENVIVNKRLNLTGEDRNFTIINGSGSGDVVYIDTDWVNITGFTVTNSGSGRPSCAGIKLDNVHNCRVYNNIFLINAKGIHLFSSSNNNITNNNFSLNNLTGILLSSSSNNNYVIGNSLYDNDDGIAVSGSINNTIKNNLIISNKWGIYFESSLNNKITYNTISANTRWGLYLEDGSIGNIFHHNNIINNTNQSYDESNNGNQWDNGYPSGGNFWSDYVGEDFFSGPSQDIPGNDGIGDTNYSIDSDSRDNYPLMAPTGNCIFLYEGWNLVSVPFIQSDTNLGAVLSSIDGRYNAVQWYNVSDNSDHWKHNCTSKPSRLNDLDTIDHTMGFWIHITEPGGVLFEYPGTQPTQNQTISLHPGWNLVGYPSLTSYNRTQGLNNLTFDTHVDSIWTYNAAAQKWEEIRYLDYFVTGRGYWIHALTACVWEVPL